MKNLMKRLKFNFAKQISNERGQGMLEYILLVVVIVGLVFALKGPLGTQVESIKTKLQDSIGQILGG